ncbi:hypothetical protein ACHAWO_006712 [Cyclotella atomus]|uniref:DWNN domain-containing protein n=1 Tax=Cyclotella atomus TaxID=382360 RepID=A0ABD3PCX3_9STRA
MSTILYKFRSSTSYTPLHLPGTSARLLDIKRAIIRDKKLDSASSAPSSLEFDLQISNAATDEVYENEDAIVPRGTRVVVRRVACERGRGILNRLAGHDVAAPSGGGVDKSDFYTFRQNGGEEEDEFVDSTAQQQQDENKELEALKAVTDQAGEVFSGQGRIWTGGPGGASRGGGAPHFPKPPPKQHTFRPDADPELRMQAPKTKKRATGIPRTFLSEGPKAEDEGEEGGSDVASTLVTNKHAFETLVARSGGQSSNDTTNNLSYALKLTSTALPEHLTCGICNSLVKNAMLVPWDEQGRPACESCIRDGLLQNGYKCPMTGTEGVSPEDLFANVGLRKAAEAFEKSVWEKMAEMERQIEEERLADEAKEEVKQAEDEFEDVGEGIVKRGGKKEKKRKVGSDFGEDEFGGDVFDVAENPEEEDEPLMEPTKKEQPTYIEPSTKDNDNKLETTDESNVDNGNDGEKGVEDAKEEATTTTDNAVSNSSTNNNDKEPEASRKQPLKRRGPPAGYVLGPAGGGMMGPSPFNVPPPPPPPPRPNSSASDAIKGDSGSNKDSRSGSVDLSAGPGSDTLGSPPPQMMGRGRGDDAACPLNVMSVFVVFPLPDLP